MKFAQQMLLVGALFAMVGVGCAARNPTRERIAIPVTTPQEDVITPIAILQLDDGAATVTRGSEMVPAPDGLELMPGDTIQVASGTVSLVYPNAGVSRLDPGTTLTMLPDGEGSGSVFAQIELVAGSIWTRFERLLGSDERFSVTTNGTVATVRGTAFGVTAINGEAEVQVAESEVDVNALEDRKAPDMIQRAIRVSAGEVTRVSAAAMKAMDAKTKRTMVRKMTDREKRVNAFVSMTHKLREKDLRGPEQRVRLKRAMKIPDTLRDRLDSKMLDRILRMNQDIGAVLVPTSSDRTLMFERIPAPLSP